MNQSASFDVKKIREDFPLLARQINNKPIVYLDNAATGQRPQKMIDAIVNFYSHNNANVHRAVHSLGEMASQQFEETRDKAKVFINAADRCEIIYVRGVTEAVNLVAQSYARPLLKAGDEILISAMEHHSNLVPWQLVCEQTGAQLKVIPINEDGEIRMDRFETMLSDKVKILAMVHISNAIGSINPIKEMIRLAHQYDIKVLIDGAQAAPHRALDMQDLDCDFYCISGHKMFGPTGIGLLYGKQSLLQAMPPYHGGGEMISKVSYESSTYNDLPHKFEAGTPNIAGVIGLGASIDYLTSIGMDAIEAYEDTLIAHALNKLSEINGLRLIGNARARAAVFSFLLNDVHAHDLGTIIDHEGVAIRTGHHCTMPLMKFFGVPATSRVSLAFYNTIEEIDYFVDALQRARKMFA